jgi:hypothetical protein
LEGKGEAKAKSKYLTFLSRRRGLSLRRGGGYTPNRTL